MVGRVEVDKNYFDNGYLAIKEGKKLGLTPSIYLSLFGEGCQRWHYSSSSPDIHCRIINNNHEEQHRPVTTNLHRSCRTSPDCLLRLRSPYSISQIDQFTLYHGNPAPLAYKGLHTSTCPLPSIYSSLYSRALVQAGLKVEMKNLLDLVIYLEPATSDTLA